MKIYNSQELYFPDANESLHIDWENEPLNEDGEPRLEFWEAEDLGPGRAVAVYASSSGWSRVSRRTGNVLDEDYEPVNLDTPGGPVSYTWWPMTTSLRHMDEFDAAVRLKDLNSCLILDNESLYGIGLTGGGMDMSWTIAASFIALGFFPPTGLRIWQGSPSSTWQYGVSTVGEPWAKRVRAALRRRSALQVRQLRRDQADLRAWR